MGRPAELGIDINWSCHWSGGYFGEEAMNYYTEEKWRRMYQFNPMIESGAMLAFSSDVVPLSLLTSNAIITPYALFVGVF